MNTRRNFMRGLGAIVATGHAPAIVKSMIAARAALTGGKASPIPPGYRLVKGLCPSSRYGDTRFATGIYNDSPWTMSCNVTFTFNGMNSNSFNIFGAKLEDGVTHWSGYGVTFANSVPTARMLYGDTWKNVADIVLGQTNEVVYDCGLSSATYTVNGASATTTTSSVGLTGYEIFIGAFNRYGLTNGVYAGESVISRNGVEVAHLYPCVRLSDNTPLFYDSVQNVERVNQGRVALNVLELDDPI